MPHEPTIKSPVHCSIEERAAFLAVAEKGNEIDRVDLEGGFDRARHVLWMSDPRGLTGVAALKIPRQSYWQRVFADTKSGLAYQEYPFEFGYLYVEQDRRGKGYGSALVLKALSLAGNEGVFATTREDNTDVHPCLLKGGFRQIGQPYSSKRGDFRLLLFVRPGAKTGVR
jgi:GNAT superfamily N-acetyltransferase